MTVPVSDCDFAVTQNVTVPNVTMPNMTAGQPRPLRHLARIRHGGDFLDAAWQRLPGRCMAARQGQAMTQNAMFRLDVQL